MDLDLDKVLGKMPHKTFASEKFEAYASALKIPEAESPAAALDRVLRLPSVCSKRFLTTKVDRHVTGKNLHQTVAVHINGKEKE